MGSKKRWKFILGLWLIFLHVSLCFALNDTLSPAFEFRESLLTINQNGMYENPADGPTSKAIQAIQTIQNPSPLTQNGESPTHHEEILLKEDPQILLVGMDNSAEDLKVLYTENEGPETHFGEYFYQEDLDMENTYACSADFFGDQYADWVFGGSFTENDFDYDYQLRMFNYDGTDYQTVTIPIIEDVRGADIAGADIDHDQKAELLIVDKRLRVFEPTYMGAPFNSWWMTETYSSNIAGGGYGAKVCTGDFDGDKIEEFAVVLDQTDDRKILLTVFEHQDEWGEYISHLDDGYEDLHPQYFEAGRATLYCPFDSEFEELEIVAGDWDGDGIDEIAFGGMIQDEGDIYCMLCDDLTQATINPTSFMRDLRILQEWHKGYSGQLSVYPDYPFSGASIEMAFGNIDADPAEELLCSYRQVAAYPPAVDKDFLEIYDYSPASLELTPIYSKNLLDGFDFSLSSGIDVGVDDIDFDGDDEFLLTSRLGSVPQIYQVIPDASTGELLVQLHHNFLSECKFMTMVVKDVKSRGIKAQYVAPTTPFYHTSDPQILNVISAPPTLANSSQMVGKSLTTVGTSTTQESSQTRIFSISSYTTVGFKGAASYKLLKVAEKSSTETVAKEMKTTATIGQSFTQGTKYEIGYRDHGVLYCQTGYEQYDYRITQHPTNSSLVGTIMTIGVPINQSIYKLEMTHFQAEYPDYHLEDVFPQIPGQPNTYLTHEQLLDQGHGNFYPILEQYQYTTQGTETDTKMYEVSQFTTHGTAETTSVTDSSSMTLGVYAYAEGTTTATTRAYAVTYESTYVYEGTVGSFENYDDYRANKYEWELVVYTRVDDTIGQQYKVVDYAVRGAASPSDSDDDSADDDANDDTPSDNSNLLDRLQSIPGYGLSFMMIGTLLGIVLVSLEVPKPKKRTLV